MKILLLVFLILFAFCSFLYAKPNFSVEINDLTGNRVEIKAYTGKNEINFPQTGYKLNIAPIKKNGYSSYKVTVKNTDETTEKAAVVTIVVPIKGNDWTWYYDVQAEEKCEVDKEYFEQNYSHPANRDFEFSSWPTYIAGRRETPLPLGVISNEKSKKSYIMGYFLDEPRVYRIKYTQGNNNGIMRFEVDFGFSSLTKEPNTADFIFFAEEKNKVFTFRDALKEYYTKCPKYFEDKNFLGNGKEHGQWTLWMQKNVFAPWDFQIGYNQIQGLKDGLLTDKLENWQGPVLSYTEPWGVYQMFPKKEGYDREYQAFVYNPLETKELTRMLQKHASADPSLIDTYIYNVSEKEAGQCALDTGVFCNQYENRYSMHWFGCYNIRQMSAEEVEEQWGNPLQYSMVIVNPNPDLPHPNRFDLSMKECDMDYFDGYQLDSFNEFGGQHVDNYRKEHWKYESIPLVYGPDTKLPCQSHVFEGMQYLKTLREKADKNGKSIIASNTWHPCITFSAPYLDGIGAGEGDFNFNIDDRWFMLIRQLVPNKIISFLDYSFMMDDTNNLDMLPMRYKDENKTVNSDFNPREIKMERLLFWGIWPGTGNGWSDPNLVERIRPLYRKYMPMFKAISEAGYEPVTNAKTSDDNCRIERYGNIEDKDLYYTIRNYVMENKTYTVTLSLNDINDVLVYDMKTLKPIEIKAEGKNLMFDISLKGLETGMVKVLYKKDLTEYKLSMAQRQFKFVHELISPDNFWSEEEDNVKIREIFTLLKLGGGTDADGGWYCNPAQGSISDYIDYCTRTKDAIKDTLGRSKDEADYLFDTAIKYLSM